MTVRNSSTKFFMRTGHYVIGLILLHFCIFWSLAYINIPIGHDTMINFQVFKAIYNEYLFHGRFPFWFPYSNHGITSDFSYIFTFTPAFYLITFLGKLFSVTDTIFIFRLGVYIEELLFIYGLYSLSRFCHRHPLTPIIICLTGWLSISWVVQIHWNFHIIYLFPLLLFHTLRFLRGNSLEHAAYALILLTLGGLFYTQIFISATLFSFVILYILLHRRLDLDWFRFGVSIPKGLSIFCLALFVAFVNVEFALHTLDGMLSFTPHRLSDGTVPLDAFLNYGGYITSVKFMELIYAAPMRFAFLAYSGLFTVCFIALAVIRVQKTLFFVFLILSALILLFSIGADGSVAEFAYRYYPTMNKFRHIGFVTPVAKVLLIVAAGFGVDRHLDNHNANKGDNRILLGSSLILACVFLLFDVANGWHYAYQTSADLNIPFYFHYIQLGIVILFILGSKTDTLTGSRNNAMRSGLWLLLCVLLEMGSYKALLELNAPSMYQDWFAKWQSISRGYDVRFQDYSPMRIQESEGDAPDKLSLMEVWGARNSLAYDSLPVDLCFPIHRTDMGSAAFDRLVRARFAVPDQQLPQSYFSIDTVKKDAAFMAGIGCNRPKLYIARSPFLTNDPLIADNYVLKAQELYASPVIQTDCTNDCGRPNISSETPPFTKQDSQKTIRITYFNSNYLELNVDVPDGPNVFLVYLDNLQQGWQARVDGLPARVFPANIAFKAVELTPGIHEVVFQFNGGSRWTAITIWSNYFLTLAFFLGLISLFCKRLYILFW